MVVESAGTSVVDNADQPCLVVAADFVVGNVVQHY